MSDDNTQPSLEAVVRSICVLLIRGPLWGLHGLNSQYPEDYSNILRAANYDVLPPQPPATDAPETP